MSRPRDDTPRAPDDAAPDDAAKAGPGPASEFALLLRTTATPDAATTKAGLRPALRLALAYWKSEEKWSALLLGLLVIGLDLGSVYVSVAISYWNKDFFDALAGYKSQLFLGLMLQLAWIYGVSMTANVSKTWFQQLLEIRWRGWLTKQFLGRWLAGNRFHRIETNRAADNPDQRIAEDLRDMVRQTILLSLGFISTVCELAQFSIIMWTMSGSITLLLAGAGITIPGYMFWVAMVYSVGASFFMEKVGRRMVAINYEQQRREADFRYAMVRVRDHSAQIAISRGAGVEEAVLRGFFGGIRENWRLIMRYTKRLNIVELAHIDIGAYLPYLIIAPRYFARVLTLGDMQQLVRVFQRLRVGFSWFIYQYASLATLRSVYRRLAEFETVLAKAGAPGGITLTRSGASALRTKDLALALPGGALLTRIGTLTFAPGSRWLVRGISGAGKSTFLKTLAGLWPHGAGAVDLPDGSLMFLPQEPYLPLGTLKAALCYPSAPDSIPDKPCAAALAGCDLAAFAARLHTDEPWEKSLSPGEKQRLAFARVLLHRPDFLFLDEATSALDPATEALLFKTLLHELPRAAIVSVAHRESLAAYHDNILEITPAKN
ncbi:MAG: ABC transporter ATP-binding protein/permease [Opitutaceae bacterium]|jgi:putative ATP-binding cassette transporter|nr:ABC transporter ATP-binding protein/permease [Opitutaceae bacterium]